jgi:hypothetical protein
MWSVVYHRYVLRMQPWQLLIVHVVCVVSQVRVKDAVVAATNRACGLWCITGMQPWQLLIVHVVCGVSQVHVKDAALAATNPFAERQCTGYSKETCVLTSIPGGLLACSCWGPVSSPLPPQNRQCLARPIANVAGPDLAQKVEGLCSKRGVRPWESWRFFGKGYLTANTANQPYKSPPAV